MDYMGGIECHAGRSQGTPIHQINLKEGPFSYALSGKDKVKMMYPPKLHLLLSLLALQFCLQMPVLVFLARYQVPLHQSICLL